jgi:hypothetical protein
VGMALFHRLQRTVRKPTIPSETAPVGESAPTSPKQQSTSAVLDQRPRSSSGPLTCRRIDAVTFVPGPPDEELLICTLSLLSALRLSRCGIRFRALVSR